MANDADLVVRLERTCQRSTTPCGDGVIVWRTWGSGPVIVLLHGGYGSWTHWIRNIEPFAVNRTVIAPDLPGMGDSDMPPEPHDGANVAKIVVDGLGTQIPMGARFDLIGFSFGGVIGAPIANIMGEQVRSLTLVGTGGIGVRRPPLELRPWRSVTSEAERLAIHKANLARLMIANPARIDDLAVRLQATNAARGQLKSRLISRTTILADALPNVPARVNVMFGERDATVGDELGERIRRIKAIRPDAHVSTIAGAGHWVQYEAPDAFDSALAGLLAAAD
jgi:pimeloyl-ACP methyl ester carboxylesterase